MRREGRPRGMVRTLTIQPDPLHPRPFNRVLVTPPTAGQFIKVSTKPTNHSKFTGKYSVDRDHIIYPTVKSKDKSKVSHKIRSVEHKLSHKVINWTLMTDDRSDKTLVAGYSASKILEDMYRREDDELYVRHEHDIDDDNEGEIDDVVVDDESNGVDDVTVDDDIVIHGGVMADDDDGYQGFYDISGVFGVVVDEGDDDDDGWAVVDGIM